MKSDRQKLAEWYFKQYPKTTEEKDAYLSKFKVGTSRYGKAQAELAAHPKTVEEQVKLMENLDDAQIKVRLNHCLQVAQQKGLEPPEAPAN